MTAAFSQFLTQLFQQDCGECSPRATRMGHRHLPLRVPSESSICEGLPPRTLFPGRKSHKAWGTGPWGGVGGQGRFPGMSAFMRKVGHAWIAGGSEMELLSLMEGLLK